MKRNALKVHGNLHNTTIIYVDSKNADEILPYIFRDDVLDEFIDIKYLLHNNLRNKEKYCKANVSSKADRAFEMRFTNKNKNDRIYCVEQLTGKKRCIIMVELYESKKTQNIPNKIKTRIETLGGYEYEI